MLNQKTIFIILISIISVITLLFYSNNLNNRIKINSMKSNLKKINLQLSQNKNILNDVIKVENDLFDKKDTLFSQLLVNQKLISLKRTMQNSANYFKVNIKNMVIKDQIAFTSIEEKLIAQENFPIKKQSLSFQLSGEFVSVGKFIEDQNNDQKGLFLDRCIIKTDSLDPNGVIAELSYHVYGEMK